MVLTLRLPFGKPLVTSDEFSGTFETQHGKPGLAHAGQVGSQPHGWGLSLAWVSVGWALGNFGKQSES
jgi:hypothetical protein